MSVFKLPGHSASSPVVFGTALALGAALLQWLVYPLVGNHIPYAFFLPALTFAAVSLGRLPAVLVLVLGGLNGALLAPPVGRVALDNTQDVAGLLIYGALGLLLVFYGGHVRLTTRRATAAEKHLALAQDETGVGVFDLDFAEGTAYVSPSLCRLLEQPVTLEPIDLQQWFAALGTVHVEDAQRAMQERLSRGEMRYEREQRIELPSGRVVWILNRVQLDASADGRLIQARGASVDITARKQVNDELLTAQAQLREEVEDLQHVHAFSLKLVAAGDDLPAAARTLLELLMKLYRVHHGLVSLSAPPGDTASAVAVAGFPEAGARQAHALDAAGSNYDALLAGHRALSESHGLPAMQSHALMSGLGEAIGVVSVMFERPFQPNQRKLRLCDVCAMTTAAVIEGIRSRAAAARTERRFSVALDSSIIPFSILAPVRSAEGRIVDFRWSAMNPAAAYAIGHPRDELVGRRIGEVMPRAWEPNGQFDRYVQVVESGEPAQFEISTQASNQGIRWYSVVASEVEGSVAVWFANITDRKLNEQALESAAKRKDEFLATLAHELRNPLAAIRHGVQIARAVASTDAQKRWGHAVIDRQVTQMSLLLDDLLDLARVGRGTLILRKSRESLQELLNTAIESARAHVEAKHHRLELDLPSDPIRLEVDPLRMTQVIVNLLVNAAKYTDSGGFIRLSAAVETEGLAIRIRDNGIGLTPEQLERVFDMYAQIPTALDRSQGGLGIGLALARGLVELHEGLITASSAGPGLGAEFVVRLPPTCLRPTEDSGAGAGVGFATRPAAKCCSILIADDNQDGADSLAELLRLDGHTVHVAYDGEAALQAFIRIAPDAALLDMDMPRLSGVELARAIRQGTVGTQTLLIAVTGRGQERDRDRALRAGFDHHVTKPMDPSLIQALIANGRTGASPCPPAEYQAETG